MTTGIYIDDSGNSGLMSKSQYDSPNRKSWLALLLTPDERHEATWQMKECVAELKTRFGATEFHFTDIYSGNGEFKGVSLDERIGLFFVFAEIFKQYKYPMIIQTMTSDDILRNKIYINEKKVKVDNFNLADNRDFALYFLLFRIKKYLNEQTVFKTPFEIFIDKGRQKKNTTQNCNLFGNGLLNRKLQYKSSSDDPLLQLVDFVSFSMNKVRWILTNNLEKDIDRTFLEICTYADFNIINMIKEYVNFGEDSVLQYDSHLKEAYEKNNRFDEITLAEFKEFISRI